MKGVTGRANSPTQDTGLLIELKMRKCSHPVQVRGPIIKMRLKFAPRKLMRHRLLLAITADVIMSQIGRAHV